MIRLKRKDSDRPIITYKKGSEKGQDKLSVHRDKIINEFNKDPKSYCSGKSKLKVVTGVYGDQEVRDKLGGLQYGKCCYCEQILDTADIEHFRPKSSFRSKKDSGREYPGYYWLTYSWHNLLLACRGCNLEKSDVFPILYERNRSSTHKMDHKKEAPLLINPAVNRPRRLLHFIGATITPKNRKLMGIKTIEILDLNRPALVEKRRDHLNMIKAVKVLTELTSDMGVNQKDIDEAKKDLIFYRSKHAQFSAMTYDYFW